MWIKYRELWKEILFLRTPQLWFAVLKRLKKLFNIRQLVVKKSENYIFERFMTKVDFRDRKLKFVSSNLNSITN